MKKLVILVVLVCSLFLFTINTKATEDEIGKIYYASPTGIKENDGLSEAKPMDIYTALFSLKAGDTLLMLPGTYDCETKIILIESGSAFKPISVKALKDEKTVFDFGKMLFDSTNRGIQINGNYWYFYGIDVTRAGDNGMYIAGNHNTIEMCEFYANRDTGLQLGRGAGSNTVVSTWPSYNLIKNCTSYNNYDDETYGENADGFAAKLTVGYGNVFDGCIAYRNSDDGWDLYAKSDTGNVGTVIIMNCVAFENGWLLDGSTTRDGDGIGFKLGGSNMEGDVIVKNCMSWHNKLHGFSDNSNPRTIDISNCTAYNNSVVIKDGFANYNDGSSTNYNLARDENSYNVYYGLLSYCTNMTSDSIEYESGDDYHGVAAYSIFNTSRGVYYAVGDYMDASSYDVEKKGTLYSGLKDSVFESVDFGYDTSEYSNLHKDLRNDDGSINMGSMLNIIDNKLLTYCDGSHIGSKLNETSWEAYEHYEYSQPQEGMSHDEIELQAAYDALEIMCNPLAVYQNVTLWTSLNNCKIKWSTSDSEILAIGEKEYISFSTVTYIDGIVYRSTFGDVNVTLTAEISLNGLTKTKEFELTLKKDFPKLGEIKNVSESYIVNLYDRYTEPEVVVTNKNSYANLPLIQNVDYGIKKSYSYSETKTGEFNEVSKVYTTVSGVYKVTYDIKSYIDTQDTLSYSYFVYVVSKDAEIDFVDYKGYEFYVCKDGVHIIGELTNVAGNLYAYLTTEETVSKDDVISKGVKLGITSDNFDELVIFENNKEYYIHCVVENLGGSYQSQVYTEKVTTVNITTAQEFYDIVNGSTSSVVIYLVNNNIDFADFTWNESTNSDNFQGLLNGNGYTIKNLTINGSSDKNCNLVYRLSGGTIMNIAFDNIKLLGDVKKCQNVAIVGQMVGGFIHNVQITNITSTGYQSVGGMVAKVCGENNYLTQISLINEYEFDEEYKLKDGYPYFTVTTKYLGGIIGNIQKDTSEAIVKVWVSDCYADAYIGTGGDSGGYVGGIVGRVKNDFDICGVYMTHCVFDGVVETTKNYAGGILAGCDNGAGEVSVTYCLARPVIIYGLTRSIIDGVTYDKYGVLGIALKNGSPIIGRYTAGAGIWTFICNYATFADYNSVVGSIAGEEDFTNPNTYYNIVGLSNSIWIYNEEASAPRLIFKK